MGARGGAPKKLPPGENTRMIQNALMGMKQPRVDTKDIKAIEERMVGYLNFCLENDVAPSVAGCANWLGVTMVTLDCWRAGTYGTPEHQLATEKFWMVMQDIWAQKMDNGSLNPVSGIFMSKVFYGYKETNEIVINHKISNNLSTADLIAESKRLPGAETLSLSNGSQTIDADYQVIERPIECNPGQEKIKARQDAAEKRNAERREKTIKRIEKENAYQREWQRKYRERKKAEKLAAEQAQKEAEEQARKAQQDE